MNSKQEYAEEITRKIKEPSDGVKTHGKQRLEKNQECAQQGQISYLIAACGFYIPTSILPMRKAMPKMIADRQTSHTSKQ